MQLFKQFATRKGTEAYVDQLARQISKQTAGLVWDRVRHRILEMTLPEARGYVRARAAAVVRRGVSEVLAAQQPLEPWAEQLLAELALDRAVHRLMTDLVAGSPWSRRIAVPPVIAEPGEWTRAA